MVSRKRLLNFLTTLLFIGIGGGFSPPPSHTFVHAIDTNQNPSFSPSSSVPNIQKKRQGSNPSSHSSAGSSSSKMFAFAAHNKDHASAIAGKIAPILSKLYITRQGATDIWIAIKTVTEPADIAFIIFIGWILLPCIQFPYQNLPVGKIEKAKEDSPSNKIAVKKPFVETKVYFYTHVLAEAGRIAALVYIIDCLAIALNTLGFNIQHQSKYCAKTIYTAWIFLRINALRKFLVAKTFQYNGPDEKRKRRTRARAQVVQKVLDIVTWGLFFISLLDVLKVKAGIFLNSFFAVGGAGTLVLSFACKDVAMQFVSGLLLQASDKVGEGDTCKFGNIIQGVVMKIGVLESLVKHDGELLTAVPNRDLANQRLTNMSRLKFSQVSQTLRLGFGDANRITLVVDEIRKEIRQSCPHVVTDGSRPFRVFWSGYTEMCLEVIVDVRMNIPPVGDRFFEGRQEVLLAIQRALDRLEVKLVVNENLCKV